MRIRLALSLVCAWSLFADKKTDIEWLPSLERAQERARSEARPLLIEFWASWCEPCRRMDQESWTDPRVTQLGKRYVAASVDLSHPEHTSGRYTVRALPTVVLADPWGNALTRREGFIHPTELAGLLAELPQDFGPARVARSTGAQSQRRTWPGWNGAVLRQG